MFLYAVVLKGPDTMLSVLVEVHDASIVVVPGFGDCVRRRIAPIADRGARCRRRSMSTSNPELSSDSGQGIAKMPDSSGLTQEGNRQGESILKILGFPSSSI